MGYNSRSGHGYGNNRKQNKNKSFNPKSQKKEYPLKVFRTTNNEQNKPETIDKEEKTNEKETTYKLKLLTTEPSITKIEKEKTTISPCPIEDKKQESTSTTGKINIGNLPISPECTIEKKKAENLIFPEKKEEKYLSQPKKPNRKINVV